MSIGGREGFSARAIEFLRRGTIWSSAVAHLAPTSPFSGVSSLDLGLLLAQVALFLKGRGGPEAAFSVRLRGMAARAGLKPV
jgi:hypothetical protein